MIFLGQKFRKWSDYDKLNLNGHQRDRSPARGLIYDKFFSDQVIQVLSMFMRSQTLFSESIDRK